MADRPFARDVPKYPSRDQLVAYLEAYARDFDLAPRFGEEATSVRRMEGGWQALTTNNRYRAPNVVIATGYARKAYRPTWPQTEGFGGDIRHSSRYRNGTPFSGQNVLVVGCGNSDAEIALDLAEHGLAAPVCDARRVCQTIA